MKTLFFSFAFFASIHSFGQFKYEQSSNGDPLTEMTDPSGMKQGNWNYVDAARLNFRTETFKDNNKVSNIYKTGSTTVDVSSFQQKNISSFSQQPIHDLAIELAKTGNGEIIILSDNSVHIHFYFDKLKLKSGAEQMNGDVLKQYSLQKTIIFF